MSTHLEESLRRDFERICARITAMAELGARTLGEARLALEKQDRQLALLLILRDQKIDQMQQEIDRLCLEFMVRHQPAGAHLRFAYAAVLINFELERVGDYAESIARQVLKLIELGCRAPAAMFADISAASISMLRNAVAAFVRQDTDLAGATAQVEEQVDILRNQVHSELMHLVQSGQLPLAALTPLTTIARRYERVSDQAKSICHETIYISTGKYAKHSDGHFFRVLFVDEQHGVLSRMAEAIGNSLNRSDLHSPAPALRRGSFARAAKFPETSWPRSIQHAAARAGTVGRAARLPARRRAFARGDKQLPAPSRKAAQLEWTLPDAPGPSGAGTDAVMPVYNFLGNRLPAWYRRWPAKSSFPHRQNPYNASSMTHHMLPRATALLGAFAFLFNAGCGKSGSGDTAAPGSSSSSPASSSPASASPAAASTIQVKGSDTMVNLAQAWAEDYKKVEPERQRGSLRRRLRRRDRGADQGHDRHRQRQPQHEARRDRAGQEEHGQRAQGVHRRLRRPRHLRAQGQSAQRDQHRADRPDLRRRAARSPNGRSSG